MKAMIVILTNLMTAITGMLMSMPPSERDAIVGPRKLRSHSGLEAVVQLQTFGLGRFPR